jgi:hypothetical protein
MLLTSIEYKDGFGFARATSSQLDEHGLDLLLSNAGTLTPGPLPAARRRYDTSRGERVQEGMKNDFTNAGTE